MKKVLAIVLSLCMLLCCAPFAASAEYTIKDVAAGKVDDLTTDDMANIILNWLDREIAAVSENFDTFNYAIGILGGTFSVPITIEIKGVDDLLAYKDNIATLGGDFANLNTTALNKTRAADGDIAFIKSIAQFVADNNQIFGKVFTWGEGNGFNLGNVGKYIMEDEAAADIKAVVEDYIVDRDGAYYTNLEIQEKFVTEIAREMGYEIPEDGETFDETINNGIKAWAIDFAEEAGLGTIAMDVIDFRTNSAYTAFEKFAEEIYEVNEEKIDMYLRYFLDNPIRVMMKSVLGQSVVMGEATTVPADFTAVYTDLDALKGIAGSTVYFYDGTTYYAVDLTDTENLTAKTFTWTESVLNFDPPTVEIWDANVKVGGAYTPTSADITSYAPTVYVDAKYANYIPDEIVADAGEFGVTVSTEAVPEDITAIISGDGINMAGKFVFKISGGTTLIDMPSQIEITFEELEAFANQQIAANIETIQTAVDQVLASAIATANTMKATLGAMGSFLPDEFTGTATINSATVALSYKGYSDDDTFVCEVTAVPTVDITFSGNIWDYTQYVGGASVETDFGTITVSQDGIEKTVDDAINTVVTQPMATVVVDNLNGSVEGLDDITDLANFLDTDFVADMDLLDFFCDDRYDDYNGIAAQGNRILCDALDMLLSDSAYASLELGNSLDENVGKLREKANSIFTLAKQYMSGDEFSAFADSINIDAAFASEHGFNAGMLYDLDFSSNENLYVCAIRMAADLLIADEESVLYDLHLLVEDLDTLDAMAVAIADYFLDKLCDEIELEGWDYTYTAMYTDLAALNTELNEAEAPEAIVKELILGKLADIGLYAVAYLTDEVALPAVNEAITAINDKFDFDLGPATFEFGVEAGETWEDTLNATLDRVIDLIGDILVADISKDLPALDKLSAILDEVLPTVCLFSNDASETYTCDVATVVADFDAVLAGNFDDVLGLFEVKTDDDIAYGCSLTKAFINASDHIVDAFFPNTVETELYTESTTVQDTFTGSASDLGIAARNMTSINARVQNDNDTLIDGAFNLVRELGLLPGFVRCKAHTFGEATEVAPTCTEDGYTVKTCTFCGYEETTVDEGSALGHDWVAGTTVAATCTAGGYTNYSCSRTGCDATKQDDKTPAKGHAFTVAKETVGATCTEGGYTVYECAYGCGETEQRDATEALGHDFVDGKCTRCDEEEELTFFQKIANFFKKIGDFFKKLFSFGK